MKLSLIKTMGGLFAPYDDDSKKQLARLKVGQLIGGEFAATRNYMFHRKVWGLFTLLYDIWTETVPPQQYKGEDVIPSLDRFRRDATILAGYYTPVFAIDGTLRLEAKSISFARMDETEFEALFSALISVGLNKVLKPGSMTEEQLRNRVDQLMEFDG